MPKLKDIFKNPAYLEVLDSLNYSREADMDKPHPETKSSSILHDLIPYHQDDVIEDMVKLLIEAKIDINKRDENPDILRYGNTPLLLAIIFNSSNITTLLIDAKADLTIAERSKKTPFMVAAESMNVKIISSLIEAKADINQDDILENTLFETREIRKNALMLVLDQCAFTVNNKVTNISTLYNNVLDLLLEHGASIINSQGISIFDYCKEEAIKKILHIKIDSMKIEKTISLPEMPNRVPKKLEQPPFPSDEVKKQKDMKSKNEEYNLGQREISQDGKSTDGSIEENYLTAEYIKKCYKKDEMIEAVTSSTAVINGKINQPDKIKNEKKSHFHLLSGGGRLDSDKGMYDEISTLSTPAKKLGRYKKNGASLSTHSFIHTNGVKKIISQPVKPSLTYAAVAKGVR